MAGTGARIDPDVDLRVPAERLELRPRVWPVLAAISAGGVIGALGRHLVGQALAGRAGGFGWATLLVNVSGCLLIGGLMVLVERAPAGRRLLRPFLGVGVLGGYTTFSGHVQDMHQLVTAGGAGMALLYLVATLASALLAVLAGVAVTGWLVRSAGRRQRQVVG
jgi:fluoride exporter